MHLFSPTNPSFLFLLITISCDARYSEYDQTDGEDFVQYIRPVIVSVQYDCHEEDNPTTHCCNGIVLTKSYILTAADCIDRFPRDFTFVIDVRNGSQIYRMIRTVDQVIIHPRWTNTRDSFDHNIALLHTSNPLDFPADKHILQTTSAIDFNLPADVLNYPPNSTRFLAIGWNSTKQNFATTMSSGLQQAKMSLADNNDPICRKFVDNAEQHFCARFYQASKDSF